MKDLALTVMGVVTVVWAYGIVAQPWWSFSHPLRWAVRSLLGI